MAAALPTTLPFRPAVGSAIRFSGTAGVAGSSTTTTTGKAARKGTATVTATSATAPAGNGAHNGTAATTAASAAAMTGTGTTVTFASGTAAVTATAALAPTGTAVRKGTAAPAASATLAVSGTAAITPPPPRSARLPTTLPIVLTGATSSASTGGGSGGSTTTSVSGTAAFSATTAVTATGANPGTGGGTGGATGGTTGEGYGEGEYGGGDYGLGTPTSDTSTTPPAPITVSSFASFGGPSSTQQLVVGDWRGGPNRELVQVDNRVITLNLTEPSTISFDVTGYPDPATGRFDAELLSEGISDVLWRRAGTPLLLTRLTQATDNITAAGHTISCTCTDYRSLLDRRLVFQDATGPLAGSGNKSFADNTPLADIVWTLISETQGRDGGSLGLTKGVWPATTPIYAAGFQVPDGDTVYSAIQKLAAPGPVAIISTRKDNDTKLDVVTTNLPGFDFDIDPQRRFNLYYSMRGADNGVKVDFAAGYGGAITAINRSLDMTNYANFIRQSGGDNLAKNPALLPAPDIGTRPEGRWEYSTGDTNIQDATTLAGAAAKTFDLYAKLQPTYDITLAPGFWHPALIGLGDVVQVTIDSGRLRVDDKLRVTSIAIELDSSDRETVRLTVGRPKPDVLKFLSTSIRSLNRR